MVDLQQLVQDDAVHKAAHPHPEKERRRFRGRPGWHSSTPSCGEPFTLSPTRRRPP
jgi:hypothetical protein